MTKYQWYSTLVEYDNNHVCTISKRYLDEYEIYIRDNQAIKIIEKVKDEKCIDTNMSSLNPFGILMLEDMQNPVI